MILHKLIKIYREWKVVKVVKVLSDKDPNDNTLTESSKSWKRESYCPQCYAKTSFGERMADICDSCGFFGDVLILNYRVYREIYHEGSWKYQYKYKSSEWTIEHKKL